MALAHRAGRAIGLAIATTTAVAACALLPPELAPVAPPIAAVDPQRACSAIGEVLIERSLLIRGMEDALAGRSTEALLAASRARANVSAVLDRFQPQDAGPELRASLEAVAGLVTSEADVLDLGRVDVPTREWLLEDGRTTLLALDANVQRILGPASVVAGACQHDDLVLRPFGFPDRE